MSEDEGVSTGDEIDLAVERAWRRGIDDVGIGCYELDKSDSINWRNYPCLWDYFTNNNFFPDNFRIVFGISRGFIYIYGWDFIGYNNERGCREFHVLRINEDQDHMAIDIFSGRKREVRYDLCSDLFKADFNRILADLDLHF